MKKDQQNQSKVDVKKLAQLVGAMQNRLQLLEQVFHSFAQNNDLRNIRQVSFSMALEEILRYGKLWDLVDVDPILEKANDRLKEVREKTILELYEQEKAKNEDPSEYEALPESHKKFIQLIEVLYQTELEILQKNLEHRFASKEGPEAPEGLGVALEEIEEASDSEEASPSEDTSHEAPHLRLV